MSSSALHYKVLGDSNDESWRRPKDNWARRAAGRRARLLAMRRCRGLCGSNSPHVAIWALLIVLASAGCNVGPVSVRPAEQIPAATPKPPQEATRPAETYRVVKVVDGDTLDVEIGGRTERLRLIG